MLEMWQLPAWAGLWERLCGTLPRDHAAWSADDGAHARQLYQAYRMAAVEHPGLLPTPAPELLAAARESWAQAGRPRRPGGSRLHVGVSAFLTRMGVSHIVERWCDAAERSVDIVVEQGSVAIAVQVDGPSQFLQDGRLAGPALLRNRALKAHGWRVAVVDFGRAWSALKSDVQREQYLRRLLGR
jgi:hypothetical protein